MPNRMGKQLVRDDPRPGGQTVDGPDAYVDQGCGDVDRLERLWAPYRSKYIAKMPSTSERSSDPFLEIPQLSDEDGLVIARGKEVFAVLNLYPYNSGHLMVVPYRNVAELENLTTSETSELMDFAKLAIRVLKRVSKPEAINVGLNLGKAAGGSVGQHLHLHVVPRWAGDSNFMTVIGGTKVLPQLLRETRELLADEWYELVSQEAASGQQGGDRADA